MVLIKVRKIKADAPKAELKPVAGAGHETGASAWSILFSGALPGQRNNEVCSGMLDMKPRDPSEGILIAN
jgi:hypothetical protein